MHVFFISSAYFGIAVLATDIVTFIVTIIVRMLDIVVFIVIEYFFQCNAFRIDNLKIWFCEAMCYYPKSSNALATIETPLDEVFL